MDNIPEVADTDFETLFGLPSYAIFLVFYQWVVSWFGEGGCLNYYNSSKDSTPTGQKGRSTTLSKMNQLLFVLFILRTGMDQTAAGALFGVVDSVATSYFVTWVVVLYHLLTQKMFPMPSTINIRETMPSLWTESLEDFTTYVKLVLDSTCLYFQTPSNAEAQTALYNRYYSGTCGKYVLGTTPAGATAFASLMYPGSITDRQLGILTLVGLGILEEGDTIMVDKGFDIADILFLRYCHLLIPVFKSSVSGKKVFDVYQMKQYRIVAHRRIHVER